METIRQDHRVEALQESRNCLIINLFGSYLQICHGQRITDIWMTIRKPNYIFKAYSFLVGISHWLVPLAGRNRATHTPLTPHFSLPTAPTDSLQLLIYRILSRILQCIGLTYLSQLNWEANCQYILRSWCIITRDTEHAFYFSSSPRIF